MFVHKQNKLLEHFIPEQSDTYTLTDGRAHRFNLICVGLKGNWYKWAVSSDIYGSREDSGLCFDLYVAKNFDGVQIENIEQLSTDLWFDLKTVKKFTDRVAKEVISDLMVNRSLSNLPTATTEQKLRQQIFATMMEHCNLTENYNLSLIGENL